MGVSSYNWSTLMQAAPLTFEQYVAKLTVEQAEMKIWEIQCSADFLTDADRATISALEKHVRSLKGY